MMLRSETNWDIIAIYNEKVLSRRRKKNLELSKTRELSRCRRPAIPRRDTCPLYRGRCAPLEDQRRMRLSEYTIWLSKADEPDVRLMLHC